MKKNIKYLAVIIVTAFLMFNINNKNKETDENRGIFFSYSEFFKYFKHTSTSVSVSALGTSTPGPTKNSLP